MRRLALAALLVLVPSVVGVAQERLHQWPLDDRLEACALRDIHRRDAELAELRVKVRAAQEVLERFPPEKLDLLEQALRADAAEVYSSVYTRHEIPRSVDFAPDFARGLLVETPPRK